MNDTEVMKYLGKIEKLKDGTTCPVFFKALEILAHKYPSGVESLGNFAGPAVGEAWKLAEELVADEHPKAK